MDRDTAWPALSKRATASSAPIDGPLRRQHASQRAMRANDRRRRLSSEASLAPAAALMNSALCALRDHVVEVEFLILYWQSTGIAMDKQPDNEAMHLNEL